MLLSCWQLIAHAQVPVTTDLTLHLDASTGLNGSGPATWADQSGNGNDVTTYLSSVDPTATNIGGFPAIDFGGNGVMRTASANIVTGTESTIFIVDEYGSFSGSTRSPISIASDDALTQEMVIQNSTTYHNSTANQYQGLAHQCDAFSSTDIVVHSSAFSAGITDFTMYINGIASTESQVTGGSPQPYISVGRFAFIGSRVETDLSNPPSLYSQFNGGIFEVLVYNRRLTTTEIEQVNDYLLCKYSIDFGTSCTADYSCSEACDDECFWTLSGNNITANNNILGTRNNDPIRIQTNATERMRLTADGNLGIGTSSPGALLHVDLSGLTATTGVRFEGLSTSSNTDALVVDGSGNVTTYDLSSLGNLSTSCATTNSLLRFTGSGATDCSVITDDGSNVGVSSTPSGTWTSGGASVVGTPASPTTVKLEVGGMVRCSTLVVISDKNAKQDIKPIDNALSKVSALNGVSYYWIDPMLEGHDTDPSLQLGFIAQDVYKVVPEAVGIDDKGRYGMNYLALIPVLTEAIKEQQDQIDVLMKDNEELKTLLQDICYYGCDKVDLSSINNATSGEAATAYIKQNTPNPTTGKTSIEYYIPTTQSSSNGRLIITDLQGKTISTYPLEGNGKHVLNINTSELAAGIYQYSLVLSSNIIDTKKMLVE